MTQIAVIDLTVPGSTQTGRVFLERSLLSRRSIEELEEQLGREFNDPEDLERMTRIYEILSESDNVVLSVYPGEEAPPAYFAYVRDPENGDSELLACVLAPAAVVRMMVDESRDAVFETASFQALPADTTLSALHTAVETWLQRVWPGLPIPRLEIRPWPVEEVHSQPPVPRHPRKQVPQGAWATLPQTDFPTAEELSA